MHAPSSDRNLLLGILALQLDFISRDALIEAMHVWTLEKTRPLSEILVQRCELDSSDRIALEGLVDRHIARHGGDAKKSLSSIEPAEPVRAALGPLEVDPEIQESLNRLGKASTETGPESDGDRTASYAGVAGGAGGRYQILRLHDEGGLGSVFLAMDREVNREVALKQLKEDNASDPQSRARFLMEAEITGNLEHPGIVPVYGKGRYDDGRPYYAMRFVRGETFKQSIDRYHQESGKSTDPSGRLREFQKLLRQFLVVCETVAYAHNRGVIHRDLKPRNILLGPYGETLIADWGLAKLVGHREPADAPEKTLRPPSSGDVQPTMAGSHLGTPSYMSPEQANGEADRLTPATDTYSLGATLYYLLAGRAPFTGRDRDEILVRVRRGEFPPPRRIKSSVDRALQATCLKAMALRPGDRYASPRALAEDIERWLADQPVSAYPEPLSTRAMRRLRRYRHLVASGAALLLVGVVGLALHDRRLSREKEQVDLARGGASKQLQMTRDAMRRVLEFAGTKLATIPGTEGLRRDLAGINLKLLEDLRGLYPADSNVRFETAQVHRVQAGVCLSTGRFDEALSHFQDAIAIFDRLPDDPTLRNVTRRWLTQALFERGALHQWVGPIGEAERDFQMALQTVEPLDVEGDRTNYCVLKSSTLVNRSETLLLLGRPREARQSADEAIHLLESLAASKDAAAHDPSTLWLLAIAYTDRGVAAGETSARMEARGDLEKALEVAGRIPTESDSSFDARYQSAVAFSHLGRLLEKEGSGRDEAKRCFDSAVGLFESIVGLFPEDPFYRKELGVSLTGRARVHLAANQSRESVSDIDRAHAVLKGLCDSQPRNPECLGALCEATAVRGMISRRAGESDAANQRLAEALELLDRIGRVDPDRRVIRFSLERLQEELGPSRPDSVGTTAVTPAGSVPEGSGGRPRR